MSVINLDDIDKQNLISTFIAIGYTADGIKPFVDDEFVKLHAKIKYQMKNPQQCSRPKPPCSSSPNVQNWCYVCSWWRTMILNGHTNRNGKFNWSNIDSSKWPNDPKEVEKCYNPNWCNIMQTGGPNFEDVAVLIGKMINCDDIRNLFFATIDPGQIKDIRNKIVHATEITSSEKLRYCQDIMDFLQTPVLWSYQSAKDAYVRVQRLQKSNYTDLVKEHVIKEHEKSRLELMEEEAGDFWRREPLLLMEEVLEKEIEEGDNPTIVSRKEWYAREPKEVQQMKTPVNVVLVHHTAGLHGYTQSQCAHIVRSLQRLHVDGNKWADIAYNFLIGEDGRVYEGRGWDRVGAHTLGWNDKSVSFAFLGNFNDKQPNSNSLKALQNVISFGVRTGKIHENYSLYGHSDKRPTDSPGHNLYAEIKHFDHFHNHNS